MSATPELEPVFTIVERAKIRDTPVMENAACCLVWCATLYNTSDVLRESSVMEIHHGSPAWDAADLWPMLVAKR